MPRVSHPTWLLAIALGGACEPEPPPPPAEVVEREPAPPVEDPPVGDTDVEIDCELTLSPETAWVVPEREVRFEVTGGSGAARFRLDTDRSGALLDDATGAYLAGTTVDVVDRVIVTDAACPGVELGADIHVVPNLSVEPAEAWLLPGTRLQPTIRGGSSEVRCELDGSDTDSTLDGCVYTAGSQAGREELWVVDALTGERIAASLRIDPSAALHSPIDHWGGVVGEPLHPDITGGSGHYRYERVSGMVDVPEGGGVVSTAPGRAHVRVVDAYVGLTIDLTVDALEVLVPDHIEPHGERYDNGRLLGGHDLDGDGFEDLVALNPEVSSGSYLSGVAWVYAGSRAGLDPEPAQEISGHRVGRLGYGAALGDFNGDGELDLAAGQIYDEISAYQDGSLVVHHGIPGDFFEAEPSTILSEGTRLERMGIAVGACDLDGDGYDDALVSAYQGRDPDPETGAGYQGVVYAYRGGPAGLEDAPTWTLYGETPDGDGGWEARANLRLGIDLVTGDIDGDGRCDVAVSAFAGVKRESTYGSVFVYLGTETGLGEHPDVVIDHDQSGDSDGRFGRRMAMTDIDGQVGDDLIIGGDGVDGTGRARGVVVLFDSQTLIDADEVLGLEDAIWSAEGSRDWDRLGWGVSAVDTDMDGIDELLIGAHSDELDGGARDTGVVLVWNGSALRGDIRRGVQSARAPELTFAHDQAYTRLGTALTAIDADRDGEREVVAVSPRDGEDATWGGALYIIESGSRSTRIGYARTVHATYIGLGLAWGTDASGDPALLVGAPHALSDQPRFRGGQAWAAPRGDLQSTDDRIPAPPGHNDYDQGGWSVSAGDFDGDGQRDHVAVFRQANRPGSFSTTTVANPTECPGYLPNAGAVVISRPGASTPSAIFYGGTEDRMDRVHAGSDLNGDGFDDLVIGTRQNTDRQGVWVVMGQATEPGKTTILCDGTRLVARERSTQLPSGMAGLGDLDGDGCDEVALAAYSDDRGAGNQGSLRILHGYGGPGCPDGPTITDVVPEVGSALLGTALATGDVTGDGVSDVLIGASNQLSPAGSRGVVYLLDGATLGRLPASPVIGGVLPTGPLFGLRSRLSPLGIIGATPELPYLGQGLAITTGRTPLLWMASTASELGGGEGVVNAYRWLDGEFVLDRTIVGPVGEQATAFGLYMAARPGSDDLAISAYRADGIGIETGEVYVWAP